MGHIILNLIRIIIEVICGSVCFIVVHKIFRNFYSFKVCGIKFSDKHNWIIEPSSSNKIFALFATICLFFNNVMNAVFFINVLCDSNNLLSTTRNSILLFIADFFKYAGRISYFYYMITTLEYNMTADNTFREMISRKVITICKCMAVYAIIQNAACSSIAIIKTEKWLSSNMIYVSDDGYHGFSYYVLIGNDVLDLIMVIFGEIMSFYLYYSGLNSIGHYWSSKEWKEYKECGETERTHEIFITITRTYTVIITSAVVSSVFVASQIISLIFASQFGYNYIAFNISSSIISILNGIDNITSCVSIYFVYPFGHDFYTKILGKLYDKTYAYFRNRHAKQVQTRNTNESNGNELLCKNNNYTKDGFVQSLCSGKALNVEYEEPPYILLDDP